MSSTTFPPLAPMTMFIIVFLALCLISQPTQAITRHYEFNENGLILILRILLAKLYKVVEAPMSLMPTPSMVFQGSCTIALQNINNFYIFINRSR
ncbi:hypothetical protein MTR67_045654 [Solanum verrucosum]|uniref:Secreted protein n=1 Tax=Solanum verrucosum TaxID=315347 RepID=A0AAF0UV16_SOLVR|nr:hypothetical protein MTR67_045654 [Solanum verrucosum]